MPVLCVLQDSIIKELSIVQLTLFMEDWMTVTISPFQGVVALVVWKPRGGESQIRCLCLFLEKASQVLGIFKDAVGPTILSSLDGW